MNFDDFFDKGESRHNGFRPRNFETSLGMYANPVEEPTPQKSATFFAGLAAIVFLSLAEGTLVWVIFESLEDLGFVDRRLPWNPFVIIAFAVNLIRAFDRSAFGSR